MADTCLSEANFMVERFKYARYTYFSNSITNHFQTVNLYVDQTYSIRVKITKHYLTHAKNWFSAVFVNLPPITVRLRFTV